MKTLTWVIVISALVLAVVLVRSLFGRANHYSRIEGFVPGAAVRLNVEQSRRVKKTLGNRQAFEIDAELADLIQLMAVTVRGGATLQQALLVLANRANGTFHDAIHGLCKNLDLGASFNDELNSLCELLPTSGVKDFANKLSIALNRGTPLASSLDALAHSLRRKFYNELLSRAGSNETKMMVPLVALVLPVTVLFALYPSVGVLQINI